ncbi:RNA-directed RNA polymerase [Panus rudis PR-1116 ss-1]|nr:RNA-directed RNA polymerase [Panus rudis PR-1116 ss-1]
MTSIVLRDNPSPNDESWVFNNISLPRTNRPGTGKHISFNADRIALSVIQFPNNRILQGDDLTKFILVSFEQLRFKAEQLAHLEMGSATATREYMVRLFRQGLFLNGKQYRFYGHSNSQLRSRSCFLRDAQSDGELDERIYSFGDFRNINNAAKRAKRIGLLFSEAKIDWTLDPRHTKDIEDIVFNGENFSDGCGLISIKFAKQLSKHKRILFRGRPYTPSVYQIRYKGYKGVLMLHPELHSEHVHFRKSQKKFTATQNNTFSVVGHSVPYAFARLNNDVVVLLASLGITTETLVEKQRNYLQWIRDSSTDWQQAFNLLSALGKYQLAERLLLDGLDSAPIQKSLRALQQAEVAAFKKNETRQRVRMLLPKSRLLYGICDPYGVLRAGEVHVRVSMPRQGATTLTNIDVLVVRNPCLHPGDCIKLRAVNHRKLDHLVDCIVFASRGKRAAPSMMSGGDLDGDQFAVIWDSDIVPKTIAEACSPRSKHINNNITRQDLAKHFASYNSMSLARIVALHSRWARYSPKGAMCDECQELNALHSSCVDGMPVRIPSKLENVPPKPEGDVYVLDALHDEAKAFAENFLAEEPILAMETTMHPDEADEILEQLLSSEKTAVSEYELFSNAASFARKHGITLLKYISHIDFSAMTISEKYAAARVLGVSEEEAPYIWNSLIKSDILQARDLEDRNLGGPLRLQRLYSSRIQGRAAFFEYLKDAVENYNRRLTFIQTDERFSVGVFLRGQIAWNDEPPVDENVMVCSFMPRSSTSHATYRRSTKGYKLHCGDNKMELYNNQRSDTFIFLTRPPTRPPPQSQHDLTISIALQKISAHVQRQCGRLNRTPVVTIEIHVVSNRDRVGHQTFDLRFEHVQTEERLSRFTHEHRSYIPRSLIDVDWTKHSVEEMLVMTGPEEVARGVLEGAPTEFLLTCGNLAIQYRTEERLFLVFNVLLTRPDIADSDISQCLDMHPPLVYCILKQQLTDEPTSLPESYRHILPSILHSVVCSANQLGIAALVALEKLATDVGRVDLPQYFSLLWATALAVRPATLMQEVLLVLNELHLEPRSRDPIAAYAHKQGLGVAFDRAEEASDTCPCDEGGRPKRQRNPPVRGKLLPTVPADQSTNSAPIPTQVKARIRLDSPTTIRIHSHVRMQVASQPEHSTLPAAVVDAVVLRAARGELYLETLHPLPPEYAEVDWNLYDAGSTATSRAMMDAVQKLAMERWDCCRFNDIITGTANPITLEELLPQDDSATDANLPPSLNAPQRAAVLSAKPDHLALIWGPPGDLQVVFHEMS